MRYNGFDRLLYLIGLCLEEAMAYCDKCGAYIPDGQSRCLACGYDPQVKSQQASGGYAYERSWDAQEDARRREEERQRQKEERRQRREAVRRSAEAEFARRQQEKNWQEEQAWSRAHSHPYSREGQVNSSYTGGTSGRKVMSEGKNKILAALSYLGVLFILPYLACPEDRFARFHAKQGMLLFTFNILAGVLSKLTPVGWVFQLFNLYCIYKGMTGALAGSTEELPIIGKFADKLG